MKTKKQIISIILCTFLMSAFAGCSTSRGESQQVQTPESSLQTEESNDTTSKDISQSDSENGKVLVVYYSASGSTAVVAKTIAQTLSADTFEIVPVIPYTDADLTWTNDNSRVSVEHNDPSARNVELTTTIVDNWEDYDTVFIGYPIWWGIAAWPVDNFVKNNDFTGKTVIPFCTSSSSGLGESGELLAEMAGTGDWLEGERFSSNADESDISKWAENFQ